MSIELKAAPWSAAELEVYRQTARLRQQTRREQLAARRERSWEVARRAALLLKQEFGAVQVAVIGSLLHPRRFHIRSDIDLVVWGLPEKAYYRAVAALLSLEADIAVDLIEFEQASPALQATILREGVLL